MTTKRILAAAVAAVATAGAAVPATSEVSESVYERAVRRALERSQAEFRRGLDLWVDRSQWENAWQVETEHFRVRTNTSRGTAAWAAESLEKMWPAYEAVLGERIRGGAPYDVFVYATIEEYNAVGEEFGAHHSSIYGSFYADQHPERPVACATTDNLTLLGMQISHSVTHALIQRNFTADPPTWLSEGLASYFASYWDFAWCAGELARMTSHGRFPVYVPLDRLVTTGLDAYTDNTHARFIELGMWIHYLLNCREETRTVWDEEGNVARSPFLDFVRATLSDRALPDSAVQQLLASQREQLERDYMAFEFGG